ncbi:hypothetical protein OKW22_000296 [Bacilli bacterium PM5-3]|nr:hypothetical protein [Bacilli bacterium PM5-3]MDH6604019.1 hypothetical protein [Bacilli bacterium PM5-9]
MVKKNLFNELCDKRNTFFNEEQSFIMTKIFTNLLFVLMIIFVLSSLLIIIIEDIFLVNSNLSFNDYLSLCFGNICFYYCFVFIKEKVIPYYKNNPLFLIGIIYPAFFNASIIQNILYNFNFNIDIKLLVMILSIFTYYQLLNIYYKKRWSSE